MTPTEQYIDLLTHLKSGELGLLREHAGLGLDESVEGFDLFAGLWWPLREKNERAPRREVAWLVAKLYAFRRIRQSPGATLARQLGRCPTISEPRNRFDRMITLPLGQIEPGLRWAIDLLASRNFGLDWVRLTNDLSIWERESIRRRWAEEFLESSRGGESC